VPLGIATSPRGESTTSLDPGDRVVLYTDGLVERRREHIDLGLERLLATAEELAGHPLDTLADELVRRLVPEAAPDDVVVVVKEHRTAPHRAKP
jgi:serine phosphatase RsbU (regulator of sigma subunit)